ncbi:helix-turn-helix domain-containing protein [Paractinoplanes pyxinae]|uniref:helix-turn-helix domain-containing protein n=1 Tax=Paractinoplanes pyxinae TaxID=2997416 RepID=UPI0034DB4BA6
MQCAFRRYLDISPSGYRRRVRLEQADAELRAGDPAGGLTVAAVAHRWGWAGASQFTAAYQQRFGCCPAGPCARLNGGASGE